MTRLFNQRPNATHWASRVCFAQIKGLDAMVRAFSGRPTE